MNTLLSLPVFSGQTEHEKQGKLGNGLGIASSGRWYIRHVDTRNGSRRNIDRVQTRAILLDELQSG